MNLTPLSAVSALLFTACAPSRPAPDREPRDYRISRPGSEDDLAWKVIEPMWDGVDIYGDEAALRASLSNASPGQRAIFSAWWYRSEVNNGGHQQFFSNSTGILWEEALDGLRRLGANRYADVLGSAVARFPESRPAMDREQRNRQLELVDSQALDQADEAFYSLEDEGLLDERFLSYIRAHPEEFFTS